MKNILIILALLFASCTSTGEPDWPAIGKGVAAQALNVRAAADLSVAAEYREEMLEIAGYLEIAAPYVVDGKGGLEVSDALGAAYEICDELIARPGLNAQTKDVLVIVKMAINSAAPYFEE